MLLSIYLCKTFSAFFFSDLYTYFFHEASTFSFLELAHIYSFPPRNAINVCYAISGTEGCGI